MRLKTYFLIIFICLIVSCEKIMEPISDEVYITKINIEGMREKYLADFITVRKRGRFNEGREFVFKDTINGNIIFVRIGINQSKERALEIAEEYNSWCWVVPQEDSSKAFGIGDRCWWMLAPFLPDTVAYHFIRNNVFIIINSHNYKNLLELAKLIDTDIVNGANYIEKAGFIHPPVINKISASNTTLHEGETIKITVYASSPNNEPLEYLTIGLSQYEGDPVNVFTLMADRSSVPEPFIGLHTYKFQVVNESNVLSQTAELEIEIKQ